MALSTGFVQAIGSFLFAPMCKSYISFEGSLKDYIQEQKRGRVARSDQTLRRGAAYLEISHCH